MLFDELASEDILVSCSETLRRGLADCGTFGGYDEASAASTKTLSVSDAAMALCIGLTTLVDPDGMASGEIARPLSIASRDVS